MTKSAKTSKRTLLRNLLLLAVLLVGMGWGYRLYRGPQLHPVATHHYNTRLSYVSNNPLRFSAAGQGYPGADLIIANSYGGIRYRPLDDLCNPLPGKPFAATSSVCVSPTRRCVAWVELSDLFLAVPQGERRHARVKNLKGPYDLNIYSVANDGVVCDWGDTVNSSVAYLPSGKPLTLPGAPKGAWLMPAVTSADPRYMPLAHKGNMLLYERASKRIRLAGPLPADQPGMVFTAGARTLALTRRGNALVFDGAKRLLTLKPPPAGWRWGEDGSAWTLDGGTLRVLCWRQGTPHLQAMKTRGAPAAQFGSLAYGECCIPPFRMNQEPDWAAVWGDGALVAAVDDYYPVPPRLATAVEQAGNLLKLKLHVLRQQYRLTLYRNGKRCGTYAIPVDTAPLLRARLLASGRRFWRGPRPSQDPKYHQHLAYTADGHHLAWAIGLEDGVKVIVFKVP